MRACLLGLLLACPVWAAPPDGGVDEFVLPSFGPPSTPDGEAAPQPTPAAVSAPAPKTPTWSRLGVMASVLVTGSDSFFVGGDFSMLLTVAGQPKPSDSVPGEVEGWVLQTGLDGGYGRAMRRQCGRSFLCAARGFGGLTLKAGWARGLPGVVTGVTRLQTMYFAQLDTVLSRFDIPSAPLSPGVRTWELLLRLRIGLNFTPEGSRVSSAGVTLTGAVVLEAIPVSTGTQGVSVGGSLGVGF